MSMTSACGTLFLAVMTLCLAGCSTDQPGDDGTLHLTLRQRVQKDPKDPKSPYEIEKTMAKWDSSKTAIIVIDMWDDHWCKGAAHRVDELAVYMNDMLKTAREKGIFIIHSPATVTEFYDGMPPRVMAKSAKFVPTPVPLATAQRWGTAWLYPDKTREPELPIDDSDMGCDDTVKCEISSPWKRENPLIQIDASDAVTDNGQECWNLLEARGIKNVIVCGVHLNMCVLGRPTGIRQLVKLGKNVVLMRDMTDTMYSRSSRPFVSHFEGTALVVEHVEKYWCPTMSSTDITGSKPFRFKEDKRVLTAKAER